MTRTARTHPLRTDDAVALRDHVRGMHDDFVDFVSALARIESPTDVPGSQRGVQDVMIEALEELGFSVRLLPGRISGGHLYAVPRGRPKGRPGQLLIGHGDTVWPIGTLQSMPVHVDDGRLFGPGTLDMKGGLTQMVFALRALRDLGHQPTVAPVIFINSDEETGSPDSRTYVRRISRRVCRALVLEPSLGMDGKIKTARKGVGNFSVTVRGRAAHAGLDPELGRSAILELSHVIQYMHGLNDPERGTTVNVGVVTGGTRSNVVPSDATAEIDLRVTTVDEGVRLEKAIKAVAAVTGGVSIDVEGDIRIPPLERTERNMVLWTRAKALAGRVGLELDHAMAGGGSDGNTTSQFTATLDGLGCVGDGAHADHEHIEIRPSLDRCALLAQLLMEPQSVGTPSGSMGAASGDAP